MLETFESRNYFVFLTQECNLRCNYCFTQKESRRMSPETISQTVKFILNDTKSPSVQFFGGEPTYEWKSLVSFVEQAEALSKELGKKIKFGMTTNGTLLTEDRLQFLKAHDLKFLLSLDGRKETHDKHRVFKHLGAKNGPFDNKELDLRFASYCPSSFDRIPLKRIKELFPNTEIRPTILPDTIGDFDLDVRFIMEDCGFSSVATEVAYEAVWDDASMGRARTMFSKLVDLYVARKKQNLPVHLKFIEDARGGTRSGGKTACGPVCGTGRNSMGVDADGRLFPCQRWAGYENKAVEFCFGNVRDGVNNVLLESIQSVRREHMKPVGDYDCTVCAARFQCMGGCNAMNWEVTGSRELISKNHCQFQRLWAELGLLALAKTGELFAPPKQKAHSCGHRRRRFPTHLVNAVNSLSNQVERVGSLVSTEHAALERRFCT